MQKTEQMLIGLLADLGPGMRTLAADALVELSDTLAPTLTVALNSENPQVRKLAAVALSRINPDQFVQIIRKYMEQDILSLHKNNVQQMVLESCNSNPSVAMLQKIIRERNVALSDDLFFLLAAIYGQATTNTIRQALESENAEKWQGAIKDLERLTEREIAARIGELFDHTLTPERILKISADRSGIAPETNKVLLQLAGESEDPLLRALALVSLGEIFAKPVAATVSSIETAARRTRDVKPSSLFSQIAGEDEPTAKVTPSEFKKRPTDLLGSLFDSDATKKLPANPSEANIESKPNPCQTIFNRSEVEAVIVANTTHAVATIRTAALAAKRLIDGNGILDTPSVNGSESLSLPERMNILGKVSFFAGLPAENLAMLATLCEELRFAENDIIVREGDSDSALFVVAAGKIRLEKSGQRQDTSALISTVETGEAFGELTLLENSPRVSTALAAAPSLVLKLAPEALVALTRQHPELSVQLISVLTKRLREMEERVADRTPSKSRMLHKIYDKLD